MQIKNKIILGTILSNLLVGNIILILGGLNSFDNTINYTLMLGMSVACIIVYLFVFNTFHLHTYSLFKLTIISVACCMLIILLGNSITILLHDPGSLIATLLMGIAGNIILFPISLVLGLLNLFWFNQLKNNRSK